MNMVVGVWLTPKKRGRDDEIIERDRKIAQQRRRDEQIAKRNKNRNQKQRPTATTQKKLDAEATVLTLTTPTRSRRAAAAAAQNDEQELSINPFPIVRNNDDVCTKHRRKRISLQRDLFPNESSRKLGKETRRKNRRNLLFERDDAKQKKLLDKYPIRAQQSAIKRSSNRTCSTLDNRKRNRIITPDNIGVDPCFDHDQTKSRKKTSRIHHHDRSRRYHEKAKVLFATRDLLVRSTPTGDDTPCAIPRDQRRRGCHRSIAAKNGHEAKGKKRKQRVCNALLGLQLDFVRSAKHFYETTQRKRVTKNDTKKVTTKHAKTVAFAAENGIIPNSQSPIFCKRYPMDPKFNVLQQLHRESASINGTLKSSRKLLMDAISSNCCGNNRINSSNNTGMFHTLDKIQSSKIEPKATKLLDTRSTVSEETNARICREDTQKLSTHREDLKMKKLDREEERISQSIQSPKTRMADCRKESDEKSVAQPCSVDHHFDIGVGAGVDLSCKFKHTGNGTIRSDDYDDDGIRPQKQSSLSSAMLSLPMNATSSPLMSSCNDDDDNKHDSILESQIQVGNLNNRKSPVSVEEGRSVADPLTDIEYWQGIVEEEKKKNEERGLKNNISARPG